jgi:DNA polymerase III delta subunit
MPKLEPKAIQKELESGLIWPVYWIYGAEKMKSRELVKRIRKAVLGEESSSSSVLGLSEESMDAPGLDAASVVDAAQSPALGGGTRLIIIRDAHALKNPDSLSDLFGPKQAKDNLSSVCIFLSKDFDARKKISKLLAEKAAVVACEEILENERDAWIQYLAKKKGVTLSEESLVQLTSLDPWSLDIIEQELEKFSLDPSQSGDVFLGGSAPGTGSESFLDALFTRNLQQSLVIVEGFAGQPEQALPLLGLFAWNVRHLGLLLADEKAGTRVVKLSPYVADKLRAWTRYWSLEDVLALQSKLQELDFNLKQTPLLPVGVWSDLVVSFCG